MSQSTRGGAPPGVGGRCGEEEYGCRKEAGGAPDRAGGHGDSK